MPRPDFDALILAADRQCPDPVTIDTQATCKAFVEIGGQPMISRVIAALRGSGLVNSIAISVHPNCNPREGAPIPRALQGDPDLDWIDANASVSESVQAHIHHNRERDRPLIVTTADHPLLTGAHVADFLQMTRNSDAAAVAGIVPYSLVKTVYPGSVRTRLAFRDEIVTGCNLFAFMGARAIPAIRYWQQLESYQKQPLRRAMSIGPFTLLSYMAGWLSLRGVTRKLERCTGVPLAFIRLTDPDLAVDVDSPEDLILVSRILANRAISGEDTATERPSAEITEIDTARKRNRGVA